MSEVSASLGPAEDAVRKIEAASAYADEAVVIRPPTRWLFIDVRALWRFRDLLFALTSRDIRLRYRQTFLGASWVIIQPLLGAAIFSVVFGIIAKMPNEGVPYFVISYSGLLGWTLFSASLSRIGACLVANAELIRKVYFPRLILPFGIIPCTLLDFVVGLAFMGVLLAIYGIGLSWGILVLPIAVAILVLLALGAGLIAGSFAVRYRDVSYVLPLFLQLLMYASPIGYSANAVPSYIRPFYALNPLVAPIEAMRWGLLGVGKADPQNLTYSALFGAILFVIGLVVFRVRERNFADVI